jgi:hypothetical protein
VHSERFLNDLSCDALAAATVVIAAFALEVTPTPAQARPAAVAPSATTVPAAPGPVSAAARTIARSRDHVALAFDLRVGGDVGTGPAVSAGLGVGARLEVGSYRIAAAGTYWAPRQAGAGAGAIVDLVQGSVGACRVLPILASPELSACGGLDVGVIRARAFGVREPLSPTVAWLAGTVGLWLRAGSGPASVMFGVEGLAPVSRPRFFLHEQGLVYRPSAVAGRIWAVAGWRFP